MYVHITFFWPVYTIGIGNDLKKYSFYFEQIESPLHRGSKCYSLVHPFNPRLTYHFSNAYKTKLLPCAFTFLPGNQSWQFPSTYWSCSCSEFIPTIREWKALTHVCIYLCFILLSSRSPRQNYRFSVWNGILCLYLPLHLKFNYSFSAGACQWLN